MYFFKFIHKISDGLLLSNGLLLSMGVCSCLSESRSPVIINKSTKDNDENSIIFINSQSPPDVSKYKEGQRIGLVDDTGSTIQFYKLAAGGWIKEGNIASGAAPSEEVIKAYLSSDDGKQLIESYTDPKIEKKADKTYVDAEVNKKADKTYVDTELNNKADKKEVKEVADSNQNFQKLQDKIKNLSTEHKNQVMQMYFRDPSSFMKSYSKFKDAVNENQLYNLVNKMGASGFIKDYERLKNLKDLKQGDTSLDTEMGSRWFYDEASGNFRFFMGSGEIIKFAEYDMNIKQKDNIGW